MRTTRRGYGFSGEERFGQNIRAAPEVSKRDTQGKTAVNYAEKGGHAEKLRDVLKVPDEDEAGMPSPEPQAPAGKGAESAKKSTPWVP